MQLTELISAIQTTHEYTQRFAVQQTNVALTIRNWVIGFYIVEYEQQGEDRAEYGTGLFKELGRRLAFVKGAGERNLYLFKDFYVAYPWILQTVSAKLQSTGYQLDTTFLSKLEKMESIQSKEIGTHSFPADMLLSRLSFSHFIELTKADTPLKRAFYEVQAIKNNWSVRELGRAMSTLLFERIGLSIDKESVIGKVKDKMPVTSADLIKNPYLLEFLGLEEKSEYSESDLEQAIITHLQRFLIELGRGFCFEARQKRITFDNKHYHIDLVFYHRIIKCHVLVDLKIGAFDHADAGQMNMYLNYFRKNEMTEKDNPPVGIILCADQNNSLVEYATAGLAQEIFVRKYLVQLPSVEELKQMIEKERKALYPG